MRSHSYRHVNVPNTSRLTKIISSVKEDSVLMTLRGFDDTDMGFSSKSHVRKLQLDEFNRVTDVHDLTSRSIIKVPRGAGAAAPRRRASRPFYKFRYTCLVRQLINSKHGTSCFVFRVPTAGGFVSQTRGLVTRRQVFNC